MVSFEGTPPTINTDLPWYILFVHSNREKRVEHHLSNREIEHFLPAYKYVSRWKDRQVKLESPLFPGYIFVKLRFLERAKAISVPFVVGFVGTRNSPATISEEEITWIKKGSQDGRAQPHAYLNVGTSVMIRTGALAGIRGTLIKHRNSFRVAVSIDAISRAYVVEVDRESIVALDLPISGESPGWRLDRGSSLLPERMGTAFMKTA